MKGLLLKDWYELCYQYRWFLLLLVAAGLTAATGLPNATFWGCYMMIMVAMIPLNSMGYDEKSGWQIYSRCFPVPSKQLVAEKYLLGIIAQFGALCVYLLFSAIFLLVPEIGNSKDEFFMILSLMITIGFVPLAVMMPLNIRFGLEKARIILILFLITASIGMGAIFAGVDGIPLIRDFFASLNPYIIYGILPLISICLLAVSYVISIRVHKKKES